MIRDLLKAAGFASTDDVVEFLTVGLATLPAMLFIGGERNAAAVVVLLLINGLLVLGMRSRDIENRRDTEEAMRREIAGARKSERRRR